MAANYRWRLKEFIAVAVLMMFFAGATTRVAATEFEELVKTYDYEPGAVEFSVGEAAELRYSTRRNFSYASPGYPDVEGILNIPLKGEPPFPCVIVLHGYVADKTAFNIFMGRIAQFNGWATVAIDIVWHGKRMVDGKDILSTDLEADVGAMEATIIDLRRLVDFLETRPEIDKDKIAFVGYSLGSFIGGVYVTVEERISGAALFLGAGSWADMAQKSVNANAQAIVAKAKAENIDLKTAFETVDSANFIAHFAPRPLLMVNVVEDTVVPREAAQALFDAALEPKKIIWNRGVHYVDQVFMRKYFADWAQEALGWENGF